MCVTLHACKLQLGCNRLFSVKHMACTYTCCNLALFTMAKYHDLALVGASQVIQQFNCYVYVLRTGCLAA